MRIFLSNLITLVITIASATTSVMAADPTSTNYTMDECRGSAMPYVVPANPVSCPDSLTPVMINHVGRHGARYMSSPRFANTLLNALSRADSLGTLTATGKKLRKLTDYIITISQGRWGALDSLGMAEQRGIASRMYATYPQLFQGHKINAISSYSPRCIMSMYEFTHQLSRLDNKVEIYTSSGRQNSPLMRFFDNNEEYREAVRSEAMKSAYSSFAEQTMTLSPLHRVLGNNYPLGNDAADIAMAEYEVVAATAAIGIPCDMSEYFTRQEINALWSIKNLSQYLQRTLNTISAVPAEIASPLLRDLITTTDAVAQGKSNATVMLRFGHAETLMPLLSLMHLQGCYYLTNYFDTVGKNWKNFHVVPMAANLQMILFRSDRGHYYVRFDVNEQPATLRPDGPIYIPWNEAKTALNNVMPLWEQL